MAKIKLVKFDLVSLLDESKKLVDYLQRVGFTELENVEDEEIIKYKTDYIVDHFLSKNKQAVESYKILEKYCNVKKGFLDSFSDYDEISYSDYRTVSDRADEIMNMCYEISELENSIKEVQNEISSNEALMKYYEPWLSLDIPMASKRTLTTNIFIGTFPKNVKREEILSEIREIDDSLDDVEIEIVSSQKMLTCAVIMCHCSSGERLTEVLREIGFTVPDKIAKQHPEKAIENCKKEISVLQLKTEDLINQISAYKDDYKDIRYLADYYIAQADKYRAVENSAASAYVFYLRGYMPERVAEDVKFEIERQFTAYMELTEPDYENEDVPVLIENKSFGAGVEAITDMYSPPSNKDIDPNPIMAFFYYAFFGLMLSDAGYGLLMVIFSLFAKKKLRVSGNLKKSADMVLYCGISTCIWGALFGGWFGDLIPTICTAFLGMENPPRLALWLEPMNNSMELLMYCFIFGVIHLTAGFLIRFYILIKERNFISAFFDVIPVMMFLFGFAIFGGGFIFTIPEKVRAFGTPLLCIGALLIVLTAGRSGKNIIGKLGGGLYALYNAASGYLGDILSYSRLLALSLVTGVIANVVNLLGAMFENVFAFVIIFIIGHTVNIAINLIGTYVHTNRLQYVEFFSKFYEGSGRAFTPFKINSKYFKITEENKYG